MSTMFLANDDNFSKEIARSFAKGYYSLHIDDDVEVTDSVKLVSDGNTLVMKKVEPEEGEDVTEYAILCKEFGLFGYAKKLAAEISVLFCDGGYMLVTLKKGALIMRMENEIVAPNIEANEDDLVCGQDDIFWVNAEYLLGYSKYWGEKSRFVHDFEFAFVVSGGKSGGSYAFSLKKEDAKDKDISLGQYMAYLKQQEAKQSYKDTKKLMKNIAVGNTMQLDFDEDDEEEYEEDDEDGGFFEDEE